MKHGFHNTARSASRVSPVRRKTSNPPVPGFPTKTLCSFRSCCIGSSASSFSAFATAASTSTSTSALTSARPSRVRSSARAALRSSASYCMQARREKMSELGRKMMVQQASHAWTRSVQQEQASTPRSHRRSARLGGLRAQEVVPLEKEHVWVAPRRALAPQPRRLAGLHLFLEEREHGPGVPKAIGAAEAREAPRGDAAPALLLKAKRAEERGLHFPSALREALCEPRVCLRGQHGAPRGVPGVPPELPRGLEHHPPPVRGHYGVGLRPKRRAAGAPAC